MTQQPATRKYSDEKYGSPGYWYYYWPALKCVFRADCPLMFNPLDGTVELTLSEYLALRVRLDRERKIPAEFLRLTPRNGDFYYYWDSEFSKAFKRRMPLAFNHHEGFVQLYPGEYIDLSIRLGQNENDTLL